MNSSFTTMKKVLTNTAKLCFVFTLLATCYSFAQITIENPSKSTSSITVFSKNGEEFFLYLNGVQQNTKPQANVKVNNLNADTRRQVKIRFRRGDLEPVTRNILIKGFSDENADYDVTYRIKQKRNGRYVLRYYSRRPIQVSEPVVATPPPVNNEITTIKTTTQGNTSPSSSEGMSVKVKVLDKEVGFGFNINTGGSKPAGTTTTTTTTTTSSSNSGNLSTTSSPRCVSPMSAENFAKVKRAISGAGSFDENRLRMAKLATKNACMKTDQIRQVMRLFSFGNSRLDFAKHAYAHAYDKQNYTQLVNSFTFSSNKEALMKFLESK